MPIRVPRVAAVCLTDPWGPPTGGTLRTKGLISAMRLQGLEVDVLFPPTPVTGLGPEVGQGKASVGERTIPSAIRDAKRQFLPMPTLTGGRNPQLARRLAAGGYDGVVVNVLSQVQLAHKAGAPLWLDFMDLWSEFGDREKQTRRGAARLTAGLQARHLHNAEIRFCRRAAVVTTAGWHDREVLRAAGANAAWLPPSFPDARFSVRSRRGSSQPTVGMLGNFGYWPNVDAYDALVRHWLPGIRRAGWRCVVAGLGSERLSPTDGIDILGPVGDVMEFYGQTDATLAPIRLGGGIKVKILESLIAGVPVVGTPVALEGLPPEVRSLVHETRLDGDVEKCLGALVPVSPTDERLRTFSESANADAVGSLISQWLRGGSQSA